MNRGPTARNAIDSRVVVAFLDAHTAFEYVGTPRRRRRLINGKVPNQDTDCRIIRRWTKGETATPKAVARLLGVFDLTMTELQTWARSTSRVAVLRGTVPTSITTP